jgi:hypothetical protein
MKKILVLPTWILVGILRPTFPKNHAWKHKRFSLTDWANGSTELNDTFSFSFWLGIFLLIFFICKIIYGMKLKNKTIGGRVQINKVLISITPKDGWKYQKKVLGTIVETKPEYEQYYHTSDGLNISSTKHIIDWDWCKTFAIKLDDDLKDIEGNNIIIVREFNLKFLDYLPEKIKMVTKAEYNKALKVIETYNYQQTLK